MEDTDKTTLQSDISFENAFHELEEIVKQLESSEIQLEQSVKMYKKAHLLSKYCQDILSKATLLIEEVNEPE